MTWQTTTSLSIALIWARRAARMQWASWDNKKILDHGWFESSTNNIQQYDICLHSILVTKMRWHWGEKMVSPTFWVPKLALLGSMPSWAPPANSWHSSSLYIIQMTVYEAQIGWVSFGVDNRFLCHVMSDPVSKNDQNPEKCKRRKSLLRQKIHWEQRPGNMSDKWWQPHKAAIRHMQLYNGMLDSLPALSDYA